MYSITTSNITIMVTNMNNAIDFYKAIGLQLKKRWEDHYAQMTAPGVVIGLHPASKISNTSSNISIGFGVDTLDEVKTKLNELEIKYTTNDKAGELISFTDPYGTPLYFMQSKNGEW